MRPVPSLVSVPQLEIDMSNTAMTVADRMTDAGIALAKEGAEGAALVADAQITGTASYLTHVWRKTKSDELKDAVKANGGQLPTFVLQRAGFPDPRKPMKYHLIHLTKLFSKVDSDGKVIEAEAEKPQLSAKELKDWAEHVFAVLAVEVGDTLVPAVANMRRGLRKALLNANVATTDASDPAKWAKKGERFKLTVEGTQYPAARVFSIGALREEKSPTSGHDMLVGSCTWAPSTVEQMKRFNAHMEDPQFRADLESTFKGYEWKLKDLLGGGAQDVSDDTDE